VKRALLILVVSVTVLAAARWSHLVRAGAQGGGGVATDNGDVNGDGSRDLSDAVYLINWLFLGGREPVAIADSGLAERVQALEDQVSGLVASPEALMKQALEGLKSLSTGHEQLWDFPLHALRQAEGAPGAVASATLLIDGAEAGKVMGFVIEEETKRPPKVVIVWGSPLPVFQPAIPGTAFDLVYQDIAGELVFHGEIGEATLAGVDGKNGYQRLTGYSQLHRLTRGRKSRVFQDKSAPDIVSRLLADAGLGAGDFEFALESQHAAREYCVQYQETDFEFVTRLMEEEGIWYYFQHEKGTNKLVFGDGKSGRLPPSGTALHYPGHGVPPPAGEPAIFDLHRSESLAVGQVTLGDYDFERVSPVFGHAGVPGSVEDFHFGVNRFDAPGLDTEAQHELEAAQLAADVLEGAGNPRIRPGMVITIDGTDRRFNGKYYVVGATHRYVHAGSGGAAGGYFGSAFRCIPEAAADRPACAGKRQAPGAQSALVTGPAGQTTYTDSFGRVKVKFFWDRDGKADENSSLWIRVAQNHVGGTAGFFLPEVGDEVLVMFEHGDIDRPIVIGSLWNGKDKPPR
jgi:type VI secretion system secreted protein VgrG